MPSLDAAADTTFALSTIDERLDTGQRDLRRIARPGEQRNDLGTRRYVQQETPARSRSCAADLLEPLPLYGP